MKASDHDVGGGVEERPKLCVLKELDRGGLEAKCVGVRRRKIRRILTTNCSRSPFDSIKLSCPTGNSTIDNLS